MNHIIHIDKKALLLLMNILNVSLNDASISQNSKLHKSFDQSLAKVKTLRAKKNKEEQKEENGIISSGIDQQILAEEARSNRIKDDIDQKTIGMEHILREIQEVYISRKAFHKNPEKYDVLPKRFAELWFDGHPIELMDGDHSYVAEEFVVQVLREAEKEYFRRFGLSQNVDS